MKEYIITDDFLDDLTKKFASEQGHLHELIRCKDCKHHINSECEMWDYISTADDYWCKDGERKEE